MLEVSLGDNTFEVHCFSTSGKQSTFQVHSDCTKYISSTTDLYCFLVESSSQ